MAQIRRPFQGVWNIVRFNWHFYVAAFACIAMLSLPLLWVNDGLLRLFIITTIVCIACPIWVSLVVSWYVYDYSDLYSLNWIDEYELQPLTIVNINAGFDEFSVILKSKFSTASLTTFDFYDALPQKEISIIRAQKAYPACVPTQMISLNELPVENNSNDIIFLIMASHEIRNNDERRLFFSELKRTLHKEGKIFVVEHLRDKNNFLAYTLGFFHFLSLNSWSKTFTEAGFTNYEHKHLNPFVSLFILQLNGNSF